MLCKSRRSGGGRLQCGTELTTPHSHLRTLEEIERDCLPGLVEVLQTEGVEGVRYALWDMTGWHRNYDPCVWRSRTTAEQKREG